MHEKVEIEPWSSCQPSWYTCAYACPLHAQPWNEHTSAHFVAECAPSCHPQAGTLTHPRSSCSTCMRCYKTSSHMHYGSSTGPSMHPLIHPCSLSSWNICMPSPLMQHMHKMLQNEHLECLFHGSSHTHYSLAQTSSVPGSPSSWTLTHPDASHSTCTRCYKTSTLSAHFVAPYIHTTAWAQAQVHTPCPSPGSPSSWNIRTPSHLMQHMHEMLQNWT